MLIRKNTIYISYVLHDEKKIIKILCQQVDLNRRYFKSLLATNLSSIGLRSNSFLFFFSNTIFDFYREFLRKKNIKVIEGMIRDNKSIVVKCYQTQMAVFPKPLRDVDLKRERKLSSA